MEGGEDPVGKHHIPPQGIENDGPAWHWRVESVTGGQIPLRSNVGKWNNNVPFSADNKQNWQSIPVIA